MIVEVMLLILAAVLVWYYFNQLPGNYPATPPIRLPFLGHALYLLGYKNTQEAFNDLCERYGKDGMMVSVTSVLRYRMSLFSTCI